MPTLVLTDVPGPLFEQIHRLALVRKRSAADAAVELLQSAFRSPSPAYAEAPLPNEPYLSEEICAPCSIPRPEGKSARTAKVATPLPTAHDFPATE
jgi:hypothetical protein